METSFAPVPTVRQQLAERLDQLTPAQQQHVLHLLNELLTPVTEASRKPWWETLRLTITPEDADIMRQASLECRPIEPDITPTW